MKRYPGIRPFRTDEQALFFGRDADIERLHRLIDLEQLVILYGKSGYGKSSLLSAGIFPRLQTEGRRQIREIRFGPYKRGESATPADCTRKALPGSNTGHTLLPDDLAGPGLWQTLKNRQAAGENHFLLVFDQFEELFLYPPDQILEFKKQLAEALYSRVPRQYENALQNADLSPEQEDELYKPFDLKVVFSIRSDRMSLLNGLKDYLPNLLQHGYELDALDEAAATRAVVMPALLGNEASDPEYKTRPVFDTRSFRYGDDTLAAIFSALRDNRGRIETSALQIVCRYVEDYIARTEGQLIQPADIGEIKHIFRAFYERTIEGLPEAERAPARHLVEDILIKDGVRMPYAAQSLQAQQGVTQPLLERLATASLLRVERDEQGRMIYEVGHDTLVTPIAEAAQVRRDSEEKERLQADAEHQRREKEKAETARKKARKVAAGAIALATVALIALLVAGYQYEIAQDALGRAEEKTRVAENEKKEAQKQRIKADSSANIAIEKTRVAEEANTVARQSLKKARQEEERAQQALEQVKKEKAATDEQRKAAEDNYNLAQKKTLEAENALKEVENTTVQVVQNLLKDAAQEIKKLNYTDAVERLNNAVRLVKDKSGKSPLASIKPAVADSLLELAFFFTETGRYMRAKVEATTAARLLDIPVPLLEQVKSDEAGSRRLLLETIRSLRPGRCENLQKRYYPVMIPLAGGEFLMGCDTCYDDQKPRHSVRLRDFELAETETSFWQYNLFLEETGRNIFRVHPAVGWGFEGDNPVVNVSWYDALIYANWLSLRAGLKPVYIIDSVGKSQYNWIITTDDLATGYRLPTEAEWEYAARGGSDQQSFTYAGSNTLDSVAWWYGNSNSRTHAVRTRKPNSAGLYDMSGNVWEWCLDRYSDSYYNECAQKGVVPDPTGPVEGNYRVLRGGSWNYYDADYCRPSFRYGDIPDVGDLFMGFRLARH